MHLTRAHAYHVYRPEESRETLWRGVRGQLPPGFWKPDEQGMVVAVDMGFMSTSRNKETPLSYMADEHRCV